MPDRGRPRFGRAPRLPIATALAALLALAGSGSVLAGGSATSDVVPEPRIQEPGGTAGYRLPFAPGIDVEIHQGWNGRWSHQGRSAYAYDFGLQLGTPILAAASGVVSYVHRGETACGGAALRYNANYVTIDHPDGSATQYGHLGTVEVEVGDVVEVGQEIATSGRTGYTGCMPHLHFARQVQGGPVTQSVPVYFEEYPDRALADGELVQAAPPCAGKKSPGTFCGRYRQAGEGAPLLFSRLDDGIDFDWSERGPGGYWLDQAKGGFAAEWTGTIDIEREGVYEIAVRATDRVRVSIDGLVVVDRWDDPTRVRKPKARTTSVPWRATAGEHTVIVEHLDASGRGVLRVAVAPALLDGAWIRWAEARPEA